jgi:hypothetical protein
MNATDLKIIDIKKEISNYSGQWLACLDYLKINCQQDTLYQNYINLELDNFLTFTAVIYQDEIVSFGGAEMRQDRWGDNIARALTRFWISPKYRSQGLTKWRNDSIKFSPIVLKSQLTFLKTIDSIKAVIITREGKYLKSFGEIIRLANTVSNQEFQIMPGRYNVCECMDDPPESCRQFVAVNNIEIFRQSCEQGFFKKYE